LLHRQVAIALLELIQTLDNLPAKSVVSDLSAKTALVASPKQAASSEIVT
jgi:hypothetical protein